MKKEGTQSRLIRNTRKERKYPQVKMLQIVLKWIWKYVFEIIERSSDYRRDARAYRVVTTKNSEIQNLILV